MLSKTNEFFRKHMSDNNKTCYRVSEKCSVIKLADWLHHTLYELRQSATSSQDLAMYLLKRAK